MLGAVKTGEVVSRTVTLKDATAWFPTASVARMRTAVVPSGKVLPDDGAQITVTGLLTASSAIGHAKVTSAPVGPVASTVMSDGTGDVKNGGVVSWTTTVKLGVA